MSTDIFMKLNLFPEEIKAEDDWIRKWLQEKYNFVETDTATTDYHFYVKSCIWVLSLCETLQNSLLGQIL